MARKPSYEELENRVQELERINAGYNGNLRQNSEDRFKKMLDTLPIAIYLSSGLEQVSEYINPAMVDLFGYPADTISSVEQWWPLAYPDETYRRQISKEWTIRIRCAIETQTPVEPLETTVTCKDGSTKNILWGFIPLGNINYSYGLDLTAYKQVEKELFLKEKIINSSASAIATCDLEGNMIYGNPFFQNLWRFNDPKEFLGRPFRNFWRVGNQYETIMKALQTDGTWAGELEAQRKDGSLFDAQVSAATVLDTTGRPVAMTSTSIDISERKTAEVKALQHQKVESLGRMAGAIAHHYNNLLAVVMGNLELALADIPENSRQFKKLTTAMNAVNRATEVSKLMLGYLGQTSGIHEQVDLSEICCLTLPLLQAAIQNTTTLQADFPRTGPFIRGNAIQIQQVVTNLVTNAWEAVSDRQGTIHLTIKTIPHTNMPTSKFIPFDWQPAPASYACLEVSDSGGGIPNQDIKNLFDPFFTTKFTGRGMGLPVVMGIVKSHGGGLTVTSAPKQGSTFRIFLPISEKERPLQQEKPAPARKIKENQKTILLVEDDPMVRAMAEAMIIELGYQAMTAEDGAEAVNLFHQHQNDICCVLSDLTMPNLNGWETLTALRKICSDVPVILSSGYDKAKAMAGNHPDLPQAFLNKPYQIAALKKALEKAMHL